MPIDPKTTRGYLNNNPGNVDRSEPPWLGEIRDVGACQNDTQRWELTRGRFCVFPTPELGYRCLALDMKAIHDRWGRHTVNGFISAWAPPSDNNNTPAYVAHVCAVLGVRPDDDIEIHRRQVIRALSVAVTEVECGGMPYDRDAGGLVPVLEQGLDLAKWEA